tara:strand:- start:2095 stop:3480 length:1386 start_codon:yes stop_codon:yes gene_type:complete
VSLLYGCNAIDPLKQAPQAASKPWKPGKDIVQEQRYHQESKELNSITVPEPKLKNKMSLPELIHIALENSPQTRQTWAIAQVNAARYGEAQAPYFPSLEVGGVIKAQRNLMRGDREFFEDVIAGPSAGLTYLLLDFGGRSAEVEQSWQSLLAANWMHNQQLQDLVYDVTVAYHIFIGRLYELESAEANLNEAIASLESAQRKRQLGVGTIPDVLLARARKSQRELDVINRSGQLAIARGKLATAIGYSANTRILVEEPLQSPFLVWEENDINKIINKALEQRPLMASAWASLYSSEAAVEVAESIMWPTLNLDAGAGWRDVNGNGYSQKGYIYEGALSIQLPLFEGFSLRNNLKQMQAKVQELRANVELQQQLIIEEVWNSYQNLLTANQRIVASQELLESATVSYDSTLMAYKEGVSQIVELLQAQSTLADARSELVEANTLWYIAMIQLTHALGEVPLS